MDGNGQLGRNPDRAGQGQGMSTDPRLPGAAQSVATAQNVPFPGKRQTTIAAAVLAVVDSPAMILDSDAADALPVDSLIITEQGGFWLHESKGLWSTPGMTYRANIDDLTFPAGLVRRGVA